MIRHFSSRVAAADAGRRLDDVVASWLSRSLRSPLSRGEVRRWIMAGAVMVEGRPLRRPGQPIEEGTRLDASIRRTAPERSRERRAPAALGPSDILYEDACLLAVSKPPGLPTHVTADARRPHLVGLVKRLLADRRSHDPRLAATVHVGVHQRLDRDTSGVILFTKDAAADPGLAAQFLAREVSKTYHALTARPAKLPPETWNVANRVGTAGRGRKARMSAVRTGGETAGSEFRCLEVLAHGLLVEARPRTGRKHQLRVHLADGGLPILGDDRYGPPGLKHPAPRLMLHAVRLELRHPITGAPLVIESPWPEDFQRVLKRLRAEGSVGPDLGNGRRRR